MPLFHILTIVLILIGKFNFFILFYILFTLTNGTILNGVHLNFILIHYFLIHVRYISMLNFIIVHQVKIGHRHLRKETLFLILNFAIKIHYLYLSLYFFIK